MPTAEVTNKVESKHREQVSRIAFSYQCALNRLGLPSHVPLQFSQLRKNTHMKLQAIRHYYVPELCRRRMDSDTLRTISLCRCRAVSSRYFLVVVVNGCWDYVDRNSYGRKLIMPRKTFFSFHYQEDVWRAWNVRNSWVVGKDKESVGFYDASVFEAS